MISEKEYQNFIDITLKANKAYYDNDEPILTDAEYDAYMRQIKEFERIHPDKTAKNSPTQFVGGTASSLFSKVKHQVPMLSLQDVFNKNEVMDFINKFDDDTIFCIEEKIDGLSLCAEYENGILTRAETRGDGYIGEDVTKNARYINGIPSKLSEAFDNAIPAKLIVRCEAYLPVRDFEDINQEFKSQGKKEFSNPRNAAAGILRTKEAKPKMLKHLRAFAFNVQYVDEVAKASNLMWHSHFDSLTLLCEYGFMPVYSIHCSKSDVLQDIDEIGQSRNTRPYWIDGAVIKLDDIEKRKNIGDTQKYPKWAIAFKYPPQEIKTTIRDIVLQTGRTGRVTPVAIFDSVNIGGSIVSKATLNNPEFIKSLNVNIGDDVIVRKAAEIIPEIVRVAKKNSQGYYDILSQKCPECSSVLTTDGDGKGCYCTNYRCPAQVQKYLEFIVSRDVLNIQGAGPKVIEKLIEKYQIIGLVDLFSLPEKPLSELKTLLGEKTAEKLCSEIEKAKSSPLENIIKALGIDRVGKTVGKALCSKISDLSELLSWRFNDYVSVDGIGPTTATVLTDFFRDRNARLLIRNLQALGVNTKSNTSENISKSLSGKIFVITGTLPTLSRKDAANLIESNGGKVSSSVSQKTNYLVCGANAGSKLTKAQQYGVSIIGEKELREMISLK